MRKVKLQADELAVESFEVSPAGAAAVGTIHAREGDAVSVEEPKTPGRLGTCFPGICTCDGLATCDQSGCYACAPTAAAGCGTVPAGEGQNIPIV